MGGCVTPIHPPAPPHALPPKASHVHGPLRSALELASLPTPGVFQPGLTFFLMLILFILRQRKKKRERQSKREREKIPSTLRAVSTVPDMGLDPTNRETMT